MKWAEENGYTSDLDVDLTNDREPEVEELDINFVVLVPEEHKYNRQFTIYFQNI